MIENVKKIYLLMCGGDVEETTRSEYAPHNSFRVRISSRLQDNERIAITTLHGELEIISHVYTVKYDGT